MLESRSPTIEILAEDCDRLEISVVRHPPFSDSQIEELVTQAKEKHPVVLEFDASEAEKRARASMGMVHVLPKQEQIEEYQGNHYPAWTRRVEAHFRELPKLIELPTRHIDVTLALRNDGQAPAENAVVEFWMSPGFLFSPPQDKDDEANQGLDLLIPKLPPPPKAPTGAWRKKPDFLNTLAQALQPCGFGMQSGVRGLRGIDPFLPDFQRDQHTFYWKDRPEDYVNRWELECAEFRHQVEPEAFNLTVFATSEAPNGGVLNCRLTARNLPTPKHLKLPISIEYSQGDPLIEARRHLA